MSKKSRVAIITGTALVLACGGLSWFAYGVYSPDSAWRALRRAGCRGDVAYFRDHVNRTRITRNVVNKLGVDDSSLAAALETNAMRTVLDGWDDEAKRGKSGAICAWSWVDSSGDYVRFDSISGQELFARFENDDGHWLLVAVENR